MTRSIKTQALPDVAEVVRYLERHPTFFADHVELLESLRIPHTGSGTAASLLERQVEVLRDRRLSLEDQLRALVERAREHEALSARVFDVATFLLETPSRDDLEKRLPEKLREVFKVAAVVMFVPPQAQAREAVAGGDASHDALHARIAHGRTVCDDRLPLALREYLFGADAQRVNSVALVPMKVGEAAGVIAFGDDDPQRFRPDMGTLSLDRLGSLTAAALARFDGVSGG